MEKRESKSLLAKLMAAENINVEYSEKATTAAFNTESRTLMMPVLKDIGEAATDLFLGHEVGHALYTPQGAIKDIVAKGGSFKSVVNIVEDARIEKMIQSKFPGLRRDFYEGYGELVERDFFSINGKDVNAMGFMDRLNIHFKLGVRAGVKFSDEETAFVDRMGSLRTFDESVKLSEDLYDYCDGKNDEEPETGSGESEEYSDEDGESNDGEMSSDMPMDSDDSDDSESEKDSPGSESGDSDENSEENAEEKANAGKSDGDDESDDEEEESDPSTNGGPVGGDEKTAAKDLETNTQDSFDRKVESLVDTDTEYHYATIPKLNVAEVIAPISEIHSLIDSTIESKISDCHGYNAPHEAERYGRGLEAARTAFNKFSSEQKSLISYMVKEFEMRKSADEHKRTREGKTGVLNPNKLHAYKFSEDLFLRNSIVSDGKNHGFVMFIDWSGSMSPNIEHTINQLMLLALFCKKAQIPFDCFAFSNYYTREGEERDGLRNEYYGPSNHGDLLISAGFRLLHLISSTVSTANFNKSMVYLTYIRMAMKGRWADYGDAAIELPHTLSLGGTPLNEAIIAAMEIVPMFQKKNNVQIVNTIFLTDGEGTPMRGKWDASDNSYTDWGRHAFSSKTIITDPVTKRQYESHIGRDHAVFFDILKDRTGTRIGGFYIAPGAKRSFQSVLRGFSMGGNGMDWEEMQDAWISVKKDGYVLIEAGGYDHMYIIPSTNLETKTSEIEITEDMTKAKMKNTFIKNRQNKFASKTMLSKFAEFVS